MARVHPFETQETTLRHQYVEKPFRDVAPVFALPSQNCHARSVLSGSMQRTLYYAEHVDPSSAKRWRNAFIFACLAFSGGIFTLAKLAPRSFKQAFMGSSEVEVALALPPEKIEAPQPPPEVPKHVVTAVARAPSQAKSARPVFGDPTAPLAPDGDLPNSRHGSMDGVPWGDGNGAAPAAPTAEPALPKPEGPRNIDENVTPPVAVSRAMPTYPENARDQEATIVVKFVVSENGAVLGPRVLKGHPLFDAAVLAAVAQWKFKPAVFEGRPVAVYRVVSIPFVLAKRGS